MTKVGVGMEKDGQVRDGFVDSKSYCEVTEEQALRESDPVLGDEGKRT